MTIVDEVLRIDATLIGVNVRSYTHQHAEIVLRAPMSDEVARLVQQVGLDCTVGMYFSVGRGARPWEEAALEEASHLIGDG